jgi:hypothetical protein
LVAVQILTDKLRGSFFKSGFICVNLRLNQQAAKRACGERRQ